MMKAKTGNGNITSTEELKKELHATRIRILHKENQLRDRVKQVPGELFYSGVDSLIPTILSGKVSSFALNAGKGLINNFFVRKAVSAGSFRLMNVIKPSGIVRTVKYGIGTIFKKKK
jgi:hypothetical protein